LTQSAAQPNGGSVGQNGLSEAGGGLATTWLSPISPNPQSFAPIPEAKKAMAKTRVTHELFIDYPSTAGAGGPW